MTALVLFSATAIARTYSSFDHVDPAFCPDIKIDFKKDIAYCKALNAAEVMNAKVGSHLTATELRQLGFHTYGAVDAGIVPDADSNTAYFYTRWLLDSTGKHVGVLTIEGWYNTEMEASARYDVRYNLTGETVMASAKQM